ncbi:cell adhesion molecule DSCAML1-like [Diadema antillarum]|uniref:cell adhesion molecule DSCAML1-like n=1 Tax=Diadema antillarum TaxID=105358 RepID=UPI003A8AB776
MGFEGAISVTHHATDLSPCTEYIFSVVIINSIDLPGPEGQINGKTDVTPPDAVDDIATTSESYDNVKISWTEPATHCFPVVYNITRTLLLRDQCSDSESGNFEVSTTSDTFYIYDDMHAHSTYNLTVLPYYGQHEYKAVTASWTVFNTNESVPTEKPGNLAVSADVKQKLTFEWTMPPCTTRNGDLFYRCTFVKLQDDGSPISPKEENTTDTILTYQSLSHYTNYSFTVCAYTSAGGGPCDSVQARTLPSVPGPPSQPEAFKISQTYIAVAWTAPSESDLGIYEINGYKLELSSGDVDLKIIPVSDVLQYEMMYNITDLQANTEYTVKIAAVNEVGPGPWSDSTTAETLAYPKPSSAATVPSST